MHRVESQGGRDKAARHCLAGDAFGSAQSDKNHDMRDGSLDGMEKFD